LAGVPSPSLSILCGHPRPCRATPRTATTAPTLLSTRGRDTATPAIAPRTDRRQQLPSSPPEDAPVNHHVSTLEVAPVRAQDTPRRRDWSKIRQDGRQLYGTIRHTATRGQIVRYACNLLPPWPIKGGPAPRPQGTDTGRRTANAHTLSVFPTILALASITSLVTWRPRLLSRLACSHPSTGTPVRSNTVTRAHSCWTYGPGRNQDKPSVLSFLAPTIERQISALITF
jgi:hypothetical protein